MKKGKKGGEKKISAESRESNFSTQLPPRKRMPLLIVTEYTSYHKRSTAVA